MTDSSGQYSAGAMGGRDNASAFPLDLPRL